MDGSWVVSRRSSLIYMQRDWQVRRQAKRAVHWAAYGFGLVWLGSAWLLIGKAS